MPDKIKAIYIIYNIYNNKCYIGSSIDLKNRWKNHRNELNRNQHGNKYLQNSYNKYGKNAFVYSILEQFNNIDNLELRAIEQEYIRRLKPDYNLTDNTTSSLTGVYGENHPISKLTTQNVIDICNSNKLTVDLAKDYGVCVSTISNIRLRKTYLDVEIKEVIKQDKTGENSKCAKLTNSEALLILQSDKTIEELAKIL